MRTTKLFFLIVLNFFGQTLLGEPFNINLSKDLVNKRQFGAAIVSNQLGEVLFTYLRTEEVLQDDLVITIDMDTNEKACVTIIKDRGNRFDALTYVNVFNNCKIEDDQYYISYEGGTRKQLNISGISSFEEMKIYDSLIDRGMRNSLDGNQLSLSFTSRVDNDDYVVFRLNGENQRRYFYSDSDVTDFELQLEDLNSELDDYQLDLFKTANWGIDIVGIAASTGKKVYLYGKFKRNVNQLNFSIPSEIDIEKFQIYLHNKDVEYYEELEQIPEEYEEVDIEIISEYIDDTGFKFSTSNEEVNFFQVEYKYNSSSSFQGMTVVSEWKIIGLFQDEIQYDLPIIPEEVITEIPSLEFASTPISGKQKLGIIFTVDIEEDWLEPYQFMRKNWRIEKGVNINSLYHYFGQ